MGDWTMISKLTEAFAQAFAVVALGVGVGFLTDAVGFFLLTNLSQSTHMMRNSSTEIGAAAGLLTMSLATFRLIARARRESVRKRSEPEL